MALEVHSSETKIQILKIDFSIVAHVVSILFRSAHWTPGTCAVQSVPTGLTHLAACFILTGKKVV